MNVDSPQKQFADLRSWFNSPLGSTLLRTESVIIDQLVATLFGYHLMQLSVTTDELFGESPVGHKFRVGMTSDDGAPVRSSPGELPLENNSIDVVLLHHVLDVTDSPQQLLRESARVAIPDGHILIVGFNPVSLWGVWKHLRMWRDGAPWNGNFIRLGRLMDWLMLLDFKIDRVIHGYYRLPVHRWRHMRLPDFSGGLSRNMNWPFGAVYVLLARKQIAGVTPIRPSWEHRRRGIGQISVVKPSAGRWEHSD